MVPVRVRGSNSSSGGGLRRGVGKVFAAAAVFLLMTNVTAAAAPQSLPPTDKTLEVFLLGGQSECVGKASPEHLYGEHGRAKYPELQGKPVPGVWFAGFDGAYPTKDDFFIDGMYAGVDGKSHFGPEVPFGERIYAAIGGKSNVLVMKHCIGGSNVFHQWNPTTKANSWDTSGDDGTAAWLASNARVDPTEKESLFVSFIYTMRRTKEALDEAGIDYRWSGIVWVQGLADTDLSNDDNWKTFGENTARVWNGFRAELNRLTNGGNTNQLFPVVPIIDTGASWQNQLKSGKEYAVRLVDGCHASNVEFGIAAYTDTSECRVTPSNPCLEEIILDTRVFEHYGYDPRSPIQATSNKIFHWWVTFPKNTHSEYDAMVLQGRMLADAFLSEFVPSEYYDLSPYIGEDPAHLFPLEPCPSGVLPTPEKLCWIDYRDPRKQRGNLCSVDNGFGGTGGATSGATGTGTGVATSGATGTGTGVAVGTDVAVAAGNGAGGTAAAAAGGGGGHHHRGRRARFHRVFWFLLGLSVTSFVICRLRSRKRRTTTTTTLSKKREEDEEFQPCSVELSGSGII